MRRMVTVHAALLAVLLVAASAATAQDQMCGVESMMAQAGPPEASTEQSAMTAGCGWGRGCAARA